MKTAVIGITAMALAATLGPSGAVAQCCGDCNGDNEVTIEEIITAVNRTLEGCANDGICSAASCPAQLATCRDELTACQAHAGQRFPASGQTTAYGPGSDGDVRAGAALSYTDNGDGTITDNNTGLMWEKKDQKDGGIHNMNDTYTWGMTSEPYTMNGTMVTEFLAGLNRAPCFAGHCDWRIPNVKELQSIVDYEIPYPGPTVNAAFNTNCVAGCTVNGSGGPMCSCTGSDFYWSCTTYRVNPSYAWVVGFGNGFVYTRGNKSDSDYVRAVRGGL